jgi:hypothetical protein
MAAAPIPVPAPLSAPVQGSVSEDYGIQKIGFWLAVATLVALSIVIVILLWTTPRPTPLPQLSANTSPDQIALWEKWAKVQTDYVKAGVDRTVQIGQLFVTGTLLPVLTALLGYIFGKREGEPSE